MARQTAEDMVEAVRFNCAGETSETIPDGRLLREVNNAYKEIASKYNLPELAKYASITTTSGNESETVASDVMQVTQVINYSDGFNMKEMSERDYTRFTAEAASGTPVYYMVRTNSSGDKVMYMWPTPNSAKTVKYWYRSEPTELVLSPVATSPVLGEQWDDVIVHKATARVCRALGAMEKSYRWDGATKPIEQAAASSSLPSPEISIRPVSVIAAATRGIL